MKNLLKKYLGQFGLVIYAILAIVVRIPVGLFLHFTMAVILLIIAPITGYDSSPRWLNRLYDWYCGN